MAETDVESTPDTTEHIFRSAAVSLPNDIGKVSIEGRKIEAEGGFAGVKGSLSVTLPKWSSVVSWWRKHHTPDYAEDATEELQRLSDAIASFMLRYAEVALPSSSPKSKPFGDNEGAPILTQEIIQRAITQRDLHLPLDSTEGQAIRSSDLAILLVSLIDAQQKTPHEFTAVSLRDFSYERKEETITIASLAVLAKDLFKTLEKWESYDRDMQFSIEDVSRTNLTQRFNDIVGQIPSPAHTDCDTIGELLQKTAKDPHYWKILNKKTALDLSSRGAIEHFLKEKKRNHIYLGDVDAAEQALIKDLISKLPKEESKTLLKNKKSGAQAQYEQLETAMRIYQDAHKCSRSEAISNDLYEKYGPELLYVATIHDWDDVVFDGLENRGQTGGLMTESGGNLASYAFKRGSLNTLDCFRKIHPELLKTGGLNGGNAYHTAMFSVRGGTMHLLDWIQTNLNPDINQKDQAGLTPLALALSGQMENTPEIIQWLITHGADVDGLSSDGSTLISVAQQHAASAQGKANKAAWEAVVARMERKRIPGMGDFNKKQELLRRTLLDSPKNGPTPEPQKAIPDPRIAIPREDRKDILKVLPSIQVHQISRRWGGVSHVDNLESESIESTSTPVPPALYQVSPASERLKTADPTPPQEASSLLKKGIP